jgi:hypothetical protein
MTLPGAPDARSFEYARLPEDLLAHLLADTPRVAQQVLDLMSPALEERDQLRSAVADLGLVEQVTRGSRATVCAVDGGFAVERTIAVDIAMAVAVGVEGFADHGTPPAWDDNQYASFHQVLLHNLHNERLVRAATHAHEVAILADAPHDLRIYDGSHLTPVIQLNSGLSSEYDEVSGRAADVCAEVELADALQAFTENPAIIAMPKYDSSREICKQLEAKVGHAVPGDDKYVTSLILHGGEYITPFQVSGPEWPQLHISAKPNTRAAISGIPKALDDKLEPMRKRKLRVTYWRPDDVSPAYRIEVKPELAENSRALSTAFSTLAAQIVGPFVREPYPQYLADVMAKSVSLGLEALQTSAQLALTRDNPELAPLLTHSYRTEGR